MREVEIESDTPSLPAINGRLSKPTGSSDSTAAG